MNEKKENEKLKAQTLKQQSELDKLKKEYNDQLANLLGKKKAIELELKRIQDLKADLLAKQKKYQLMAARIKELEAQYALLNKKYENLKSRYKSDLAMFKSTIDGLNQRYLDLKAINEQLVRQNKMMVTELNEVRDPEPTFRVSLTPYLGYHVFGGDSSLSNATELGMKATGFLKNNWSMSAGFGSINTHDNQNAVRIKKVSSFSGQVSYRFRASQFANVYLTTGFIGNTNNSSSTSLLLGGGARLLLSPDVSTRFEMIQSNDTLLLFGLEKHFNLFTPDDKPDLAKKNNKTVFDSEVIVSSVRYQIPTQKSEINIDLSEGKHWAKDQIKKLINLGLLDFNASKNNKSYAFKPNQYITRQAASKVIVGSYDYLKSKEIVTTINYEIKGAPGVNYITMLTIKDSNDKTVKKLVDKNSQFSGTYEKKWLGDNMNGEMVDEGSYKVNLDVYSQKAVIIDNQAVITANKLVSQSHSMIKVVKYDPEVNEQIEYAIKDVKTSNKYYPYIKKSINQNIIAYENNRFKPSSYIKRIDFIASVSKVLEKLGAIKPRVLTDYSPYTDIDTISTEMKFMLQLYVNELGYGGDHKMRLRPNDYITKAEAATIINRLIEWKETQLMAVSSNTNRYRSQASAVISSK